MHRPTNSNTGGLFGRHANKSGSTECSPDGSPSVSGKPIGNSRLPLSFPLGFPESLADTEEHLNQIGEYLCQLQDFSESDSEFETETLLSTQVSRSHPQIEEFLDDGNGNLSKCLEEVHRRA